MLLNDNEIEPNNTVTFVCVKKEKSIKSTYRQPHLVWILWNDCRSVDPNTSHKSAVCTLIIITAQQLSHLRLMMSKLHDASLKMAN